MPTVKTKQGTQNFPYTEEGIAAAKAAKDSPDLYEHGGSVPEPTNKSTGIANFVAKQNDGLPTSDARMRSYKYGGFVMPGELGMEEHGKFDDFKGHMKSEKEAEEDRKGREWRSGSGSQLKNFVRKAGSYILGTGKGNQQGLFGKKGVIRGEVGKGVRKLAGNLAKIFSDVHLKENIDFVGKSEKGINIYEWNYNNDSKNRYKGVLAHELKKDYPEAVHKEKEGLAVDYDKIDVKFEKVKSNK